MEFPISREARARYALEDALLSPRGTAIFGSIQEARRLAERLNRSRDLARRPERAINPGQLNALGLIEEILRHVIELYRATVNPRVSQKVIEWLSARLGPDRIDAVYRAFAEEFPAPAVQRGEAPISAFLDAETGGVPNRQIVQDEILMLWLANANPAYVLFRDLFEDVPLAGRTSYPGIVEGLREFFATQPPFGPDRQSLVEMLRSPALAAPHSLFGQLEYIWSRWGYLLGRYEHLYRLLRGLDVLREEDTLRPQGPGLSRPYEFSWLGDEAERFSPDQDWMPRLVLLAKNSYVWLDQLSRRYERSIDRLDAIPDEELGALARWGISGLWLIGLWERSRASQRIKQLRGNADAVASAYSLFDYRIAEDLGGEVAYANLEEKASRHGIRLASDMVPNHMGIDSPWVIEHPEYFLSLAESPFPSYSFGGPDLSWHGGVSVQIEDHYFDNSDAAVVFKRVDRGTGSVRYVYHGNDGTSMPWNDTAQLNYLNPEVREAVIQAILQVARLFPVIRFDAAMTLAKRHYQRLWFPEPGTGGAIPSRAEHGLTKEQFDAQMPEEFWREVVDRVAREVPGTLLLAEAFWMMEGYFVRSLGMHRVYNSAFMNMLRDEDNAGYRSVIKNTLEFDPEILKRYVNFMNNPDEKTAIEQFGTGDKYFGIATLMATLPGLPMFGHGQVEGFTEKYGMEFRRPRYEESPDPVLVARHEREIFPLLHRRHLFAEARDFLLYDFYTTGGTVNEDLFAYSNRCGEERGLVVYLNRFESTKGWIRTSVAFTTKPSSGEGKTLVQRSLGEGLGLRAEAGRFALFRDHLTGLEYVRSCADLFEKGLYLELNAYGRYVFLDFREVRDDDRQRYCRLAEHLAGHGVPSIEEAWRELFLRPVHEPLRELLCGDMFRRLMAAREDVGGQGPDALSSAALLDEVESKAARVLSEIKSYAGGSGDAAQVAKEIRDKVAAILRLASLGDVLERGAGAERGGQSPSTPRVASTLDAGPHVPGGSPGDAGKQPANPALNVTAGAPRKLTTRPAGFLGGDPGQWGILLAWSVLHAFGKISGEPCPEALSRRWLDELLFGRILEDALRELGLDPQAAARGGGIVAILTTHQVWFETPSPAGAFARSMLQALLAADDVRRFLGVNQHEGVFWYRKQSFEDLLEWILCAAAVNAAVCAETCDRGTSGGESTTGASRAPEVRDEEMETAIGAWSNLVTALQAASDSCGYRLEHLPESMASDPGASPPGAVPARPGRTNPGRKRR